MKKNLVFILLTVIAFSISSNSAQAADAMSVLPTNTEPRSTDGRPRVIATSDGEIDDECSMVRFLLYANEWDIEAIITSSSQYHWRGHKWAGDDWAQPYLNAYAKVYPNLVKHDPRYPTPKYLQARTLLGNVKAEGEMDEVTAGSQYIVKVLLDKSDHQPVWLQAWGGPNTIARALKTIEEEYPDQMAYVANKIRFFFIWEQDSTYQEYVRPHWGKYNIQTIVSDQFEAIAYRWDRIIPKEKRAFFSGAWMKENILQGHGPLCALYRAHEDGRFRSEGDSPAFLHTIVTGLRNLESPDWGGWGGRYVKVRENTWLDPVLESGYQYPEGRWYSSSAWGRQRARKKITNDRALFAYLKPMWRWIDALQNDFAARADWCVKPYDQANHPPVVKLTHALDLKVRPGDRVSLSAKGTTDPDGDKLAFLWWQYKEADTYDGAIQIKDAGKQDASFKVPGNAGEGETIHVICEVTDAGTPPLTRYQRVIVSVVP
ncbi:MAG TPA: nucleoside hydrolase-like domain-containing protein [Sedimentisphaerales bacterium]|nr:nucleoside hydrolase-like domain-containing protein [Sedimentisphaerales bacterium]